MAMPERDHVVSARQVYDHSVDQYVAAVGTTVSDEFEAPIDRAVLAAFAEEPSLASPNQVIDIGCGPGRITRYLADRGLAIRGVDLSPRMVDAARAAHPDLAFAVGSLTDVPAPDASVAGAVSWYSIIATPPSELPLAWQELGRILRVGGHVLLAFQAGSNEAVERPNAYGSTSTLTLYRHSPTAVASSLEDAGFAIRTSVHRQAELPHETTPQAFIHAQRA